MKFNCYKIEFTPKWSKGPYSVGLEGRKNIVVDAQKVPVADFVFGNFNDDANAALCAAAPDVMEYLWLQFKQSCRGLFPGSECKVERNSVVLSRSFNQWRFFEEYKLLISACALNIYTCTPATVDKIPKGWRRVKMGEIIRKDDCHLGSGREVPSHSVGVPVCLVELKLIRKKSKR